MPETELLKGRLQSWFGSRRIEALHEIERYGLHLAQDYSAARNAGRIAVLPYVRDSAAGEGWTSSYDEQAIALKLLANIGESPDREYLKLFFEETVKPCSQIVSHDLTDWATEEVRWTEYAYPNATGPVSDVLFYCDGERANIEGDIHRIEMKAYPKNVTAHKLRTDVLEALRERMQ